MSCEKRGGSRFLVRERALPLCHVIRRVLTSTCEARVLGAADKTSKTVPGEPLFPAIFSQVPQGRKESPENYPQPESISLYCDKNGAACSA